MFVKGNFLKLYILYLLVFSYMDIFGLRECRKMNFILDCFKFSYKCKILLLQQKELDMEKNCSFYFIAFLFYWVVVVIQRNNRYENKLS